ncbi:hypothetical protein Msi02_77380 [Microbispora siamensis]|uniref:Uncharacterized protein n=1 Tax=Microbispora siamensis TaxID=564413 RepID=A0ABQ4GZQ3_9ACTN|nr:hypothetical protein Msi02_77380 [Microbispora siamensis]
MFAGMPDSFRADGGDLITESDGGMPYSVRPETADPARARGRGAVPCRGQDGNRGNGPPEEGPAAGDARSGEGASGPRQ